jgi:predicted TIM-barrel fold metal-dependent hydrolase
MRTITLEEHYATPAFLDGPGRKLKEQASRFGGGAAELFDQLCDLGEKRIAEMDAAGIDMQVLSLTSPGTEQLEATAATAVAREANDRVAEAVSAHPTRLADLLACRLQILRPPSPRWSARSMTTALREP